MIITIPNGVTIAVANAAEVARVLEALGLREPPQFVISPSAIVAVSDSTSGGVTARKVVGP